MNDETAMMKRRQERAALRGRRGERFVIRVCRFNRHSNFVIRHLMRAAAETRRANTQC
jgi:hypothetical protein